MNSGRTSASDILTVALRYSNERGRRTELKLECLQCDVAIALERMGRWVPVAEGLPEEYRRVLVIWKDPICGTTQGIDQVDGGKWDNYGPCVTHYWSEPLPPLPGETE
jgi:hypothetical protein